ncbi:MAG: YafY family transcriptional regulator [Chloroflexota bacterium]|nr:YafY family transcriptional regulator [Chloroflexota bacterium]
MRASRLLSMLLLLQSRGQMTAEDLAAELEVSVRTIYRDIDSLSAAGIPVYAMRGRAGGYRMLDGYRTHLTGLTSDEAATLFLSGVPGAAAELGLGSLLAAAQLKLLAALPPTLRDRADRSRERFHLDSPGWFHDSEQPPFLIAIAQAVWRQLPLAVRYRRWGGEVKRRLEPLGLVLKGGAWYLVARADTQVRTYRVSRVLEVTTLDDRFERPLDFDLVGYWETWSRDFQRRLHRDEATVRFSPRAISRLAYVFGSTVAREMVAGASVVDADAWTTMTLPIESIDHAPSTILQFGTDAEVVAPPALRELMAKITGALFAVYQRPAADEEPVAGE